jgi:outer membrane protein assembly factor BamB
MLIRTVSLLGLTLTLAGLAAAATPLEPVGGTIRARVGEWPQWRGQDRTGLSQEKGLLRSWPEGGPRLLWKVTGLGGGYSTPSIAGGRLYGMGYRDENEVVWARDARTGQEIWTTPAIAPANRRVGYAEGSRCTPTIDGARLYALGVSGDLVCLDTATGKEIWRKNLVTDFGGKVPNWGYCESPLIDGEKVIVTPGGRQTMVALNKTNGAVIWTSAVPEADPACYSSAIAVEVDGQRQYIQYVAGGVIGVAASDGRFLWRYNSPANGIVISTPVYHDRHVFASTAYNKGGGLVKLTTNPDRSVKAEEVYFDQQMQNHHGGVLLLGDHIYYAEGHNGAKLVCREFKTGKLMWEDPQKRKVSLTYADGMLYARSERGTMMLVEANPREMVVKGSFEQPDRSGKAAWAHPVVSDGKLYLRDQDVLLCYDIKTPAGQ